jgi:hypothetical protein
MKPPKHKDKISLILNNTKLVTAIIQSGIRDALLKHKQAGNPVCEWKNNKVVWIAPEKIPAEKK